MIITQTSAHLFFLCVSLLDEIFDSILGVVVPRIVKVFTNRNPEPS